MIFIIILITISLVSLGSFAFFNLGNWLVVSDPLPEKLDVIFVFGGTLSRARYALRLKDKYPDVRIIINNSKNRINKKLDIANILKNEGINTDNVLSVGIDTIKFSDEERNMKSGTYLEVLYLKQWLQNYLIKKTPNLIGVNYFKNKTMVNVGLVSDGFHMRRIKFLVGRKKKGLKCRFYYLPVPLDNKKYDKWWNYEKIRNPVVSEIKKLAYSFFRYF